MFNHIKADMHRIVFRKGFLTLFIILVAVSLLAVTGFSSKYSAEVVLTFYQGISYLMLLFFSVIVIDYTFKEEFYLRLTKNDMNTGVSRNVLYTSKYLSGVILIVGFWLIVSVAISLAVFWIGSTEQALKFFGELFSLQQLLMLLQILFFAGLFQLLALFVQKTILMILICGVLQQAVTSISEAIPVIKEFINEDSVLSIAWTSVGILLIVYIGCLLFRRREL